MVQNYSSLGRTVMIKTKVSVLSLIGVSLTIGAFAFAGEPAGIGEKGTGQTQKSTEREQSPNKPDLSQAPRELSEGKSAQAAQELTKESQANRQLSQEEPAGIGEKERAKQNSRPSVSRVRTSLICLRCRRNFARGKQHEPLRSWSAKERNSSSHRACVPVAATARG